MRFQASIIFQLTEMCANASSLFCLSFYQTALFIHFHLCVCVCVFLTRGEEERVHKATISNKRRKKNSIGKLFMNLTYVELLQEHRRCTGN